MENIVDEIFSNKIIKATLSNKKNKDYKYTKIKIELVKLKDKEFYQIEKFTEKQVFHENINIDEINEYVVLLLKDTYKSFTALSNDIEFNVKISKKGKLFFGKKTLQKSKNLEAKMHNKKKKYILEEGMIIPPLVDLGIFTKGGKVINSKYDKYKQINRFVEIIDDEIKNNKKESLTILDFGCGKSYLTFILYYYFTEIKNIDVNIIGLDLKESVIDKCNVLAKNYGYKNLKFELGDINGYNFEGKLDMVITLHACDTATDYALFNAINWGADMIFSVPCCQHEINSSIKTENLNIFTKYGIMKERMSAIMTDLIRANILEIKGYKTQVMEFIDIAHSPKNILIRATKSNISENKREKSKKEIENLMKQFDFEQTLYNLFDMKNN